MEVVLDRDAFLKGLQMVHNIVEPRQTLPILANVLMEADGETVRITATDLEVGARVSVPARVASGWGDHRLGAQAHRDRQGAPAASLSLKVGENAGVTMRCGGVSYRLVGMAPDDFPAVVPAAPPAWLRMEAKMLREMLAQTSFAISHDESRFALNGVLFVLQAKEVRLGGHRRAPSGRGHARTSGRGLSGVSGIVPRKAVTEIMRVLGASEDVQLAITENQFVMQMPNFVMTARLIEGQFPNWEAVVPGIIPAGSPSSGRAVRGAAPRLGHGRGAEQAGALRAGPASLTLSAASHDLGEAEEQPGSGLHGGGAHHRLQLAVPPRRADAMEHEDVVFEFKDALSPGVLRSAADEGVLLCYNAYAYLGFRRFSF